MKNQLSILKSFLLGIGVLFGFSVHSQIFVDIDATGANNGTSWANAYTDLQPALDIATTTDTIWVAEGTYYPTESPDISQSGAGNERYKSFHASNKNIALFGGFTGTESNLSQRDWENNITIFSGDFNNDDLISGSGETLTFGNNSENAYHVFVLVKVEDATFDGVTIRGGNANSTLNSNYIESYKNNLGGGIYSFITISTAGLPLLNSVILTNSIIKENFATSYGGGIYCAPKTSSGAFSSTCSSLVTVSNSSINLNAAISGAGIFTNSTSMTFGGSATYYSTINTQNSNFNGNNGGGISLNSGKFATADITNSNFTGNFSSNGGGIAISGDQNTINISNSSVNNNTATNSGGGMYLSTSDSTILTINDSEFIGNLGSYGGAISSGNKTFVITVLNTTITGNSAINQGGGIQFSGLSVRATVENSTIKANHSTGIQGKGGGIYSQTTLSSYLEIINSNINENSSFTNGGAIYSMGDTSSIRVINSNINENIAKYGAGVWSTGLKVSLVDLTNSSLVNNHATFEGGGIYSRAYSTNSASSSIINITNSSILGNSAYNFGGGIYSYAFSGGQTNSLSNSSINLKNSTVFGNTASSEGAGIYSISHSNSLDINDSYSSFITEGSIIWSPFPAVTNIYNNGNPSIVSNGYNIFSDIPVDVLGTDQTEVSEAQLNLEPLNNNGGATKTQIPGIGSVAINSGNPTDLTDAQNRAILDGHRDIGAAEYVCRVNSTMQVTVCDSYTWIDGVTYNTDTIVSEHLVFLSANLGDCDSTKTLNLTIEPLSRIDVIIESSPYTWIDGITYSESNNTATFIIDNVSGCDSIIQLDLTIPVVLAPLIQIYVDKDATGANNGTSWVDAFTTLQPALDLATNVNSVWVAEGTYYPTEAPLGAPIGDARYNSFHVREKNVIIYGGFSGVETDINQRDWQNHPTIFSGDYNEDDLITGSGSTLLIQNNSENAFHVFLFLMVEIATLDGVTVKGGNAIDNSTFNDGYLYDDQYEISNDIGGGIVSIATEFASVLTIANSSVFGNYSNYNGAGICSYHYGPSSLLTPQSIHIINSSIFSNYSSATGGGITIQSNSLTSIKLTDSEVYDNFAFDSGGGIYVLCAYMQYIPNSYNVSVPITLINSSVNRNIASTGGGGGICIITNANINSSVMLDMMNSSVNENTSDNEGGGISCTTNTNTSSALITLMNSSVNRNLSSLGTGGIQNYSSENSSVNLTNSTISENTGLNAGGIFTKLANIKNSTIYGNIGSHNNFGTGAILSDIIDIKYSTVYNNHGQNPNFNTQNISIGSSIIWDDSSVGLNTVISNNFYTYGFNIFSDIPQGSISSDQTGITAAQLNLQALANNGGYTKTMLPEIGSLAIDAGNPVELVDAQNRSIVNGRRDVGAAEYNCRVNVTIDTTLCNSFSIGGNTYTTDTIITDYFAFISTNPSLCDTVITYNVTINQSSTGTDIISACESYIWIDGVTYTESNNTAIFVYENAIECDSIVTLNLTINEPSTGVDIISNCDSYTWIDGITYTESNNLATFVLPNVVGCDSTITLNLTIIPTQATTTNIFVQPSNDNTCTGKLTVDIYGSGPFVIGGLNTPDPVYSDGFNEFSNLCAGVHPLSITNFCGDSVITDFVIPVESNYLFNTSFSDSTALDSLGVAAINCDVQYNSIDTVYIDSLWTVGDTIHVIWNIVDVNGSDYDTVFYVMNSGTGVYYLQYSFYCPFRGFGDYFTVTEAIYIVNNTTSLVDLEDLWVQIYPNPTNSNVTIQLNEPNATVKVFDVKGKLIIQHKIESQGIISLQDVESGVYLFEIVTKKNKIIKRVIRQ